MVEIDFGHCESSGVTNCACRAGGLKPLQKLFELLDCKNRQDMKWRQKFTNAPTKITRNNNVSHQLQSKRGWLWPQMKTMVITSTMPTASRRYEAKKTDLLKRPKGWQAWSCQYVLHGNFEIVLLKCPCFEVTNLKHFCIEVINEMQFYREPLFNMCHILEQTQFLVTRHIVPAPTWL